jgi:surface antigen
VRKSLIAAVLAAAVSAPAMAGQVYGDYGQNRYQGPPPANHGNCEADVAVGTGIGAVVGGIIGNQFGRGGGRAAATIGGVILGGIAGNAIAKDSCRDERYDAYYYNDTYAEAFDDPDEGDEYAWRNPHTNNYGYVTPGDRYDDGYADYAGPCREFEQRVYIDGQPETATGVACKQQDGTWRIVDGR